MDETLRLDFFSVAPLQPSSHLAPASCYKATHILHMSYLIISITYIIISATLIMIHSSCRATSPIDLTNVSSIEIIDLTMSDSDIQISTPERFPFMKMPLEIQVCNDMSLPFHR
jgi:hypothetical protein